MSQSLHKLFKQKKCNSLVHAVIKRDKRGEVTWPGARKRVNNNLLKQLFCVNSKPISFLQMFFFQIVFDKICHAIEWKGVDGTKTWIDCIEKCIFCTIYFPFSHDGVSCIITASPGPITPARCSRGWPNCCTEHHQRQTGPLRYHQDLLLFSTPTSRPVES